MEKTTTNLIFGETKDFAIEVQSCSRVTDMFRLRIWFYGVSFGNFEREDSLKDSIVCFKKLNELKWDIFDDYISDINGDPVRFYDWVVPKMKEGKKLSDVGLSVEDLDFSKLYDFEKRKKFIRGLGLQMAGYDFLSYYVDGLHYWVIHNTKSGFTSKYEVGDKELQGVVSQYIRWYENTYGEVKCGM